ncbi:hypothetical protein A8146_26565 [Mesorhizobium loti]|nr:hypothetical protein A8146_26565 [Mesorhizobium loti]
MTAIRLDRPKRLKTTLTQSTYPTQYEIRVACTLGQLKMKPTIAMPRPMEFEIAAMLASIKPAEA